MKTLRNLLDDYLDYRGGLNYSPRSLESYRYICETFLTHLESRFGAGTASELRRHHLFSYQKSLSERHGAKGLPLCARTINSNISSVRNFLLFLAERGHLIRTIPEALRLVKEPEFLPLNALEHPCIRKQLTKIDTTTPRGYRDRTVLEVLYSTGIRASELRGLDKDHVDLANRLLRIFGKGRRERLVPLGRTAARYLETYLKAVRPFLVIGDEDHALFLNNAGTRLQRYTLRLLVRRHFDPAQLGVVVSPHTFRRSCITELIRGNANLYHVKELLGHKTLGTVKHYAKLTIADLKKTHAKCHPRERDEERERG